MHSAQFPALNQPTFCALALVFLWSLNRLVAGSPTRAQCSVLAALLVSSCSVIAAAGPRAPQLLLLEPFSSTEAFDRSEPLHNDYLQVFVKLPGAATVTFVGRPNATVGELLQYIIESSNITILTDASLYACRGLGLTDLSAPLASYGVRSGQHLFLLPRLRGGGPKRVQSKPSSKSHSMCRSPDCIVTCCIVLQVGCCHSGSSSCVRISEAQRAAPYYNHSLRVYSSAKWLHSHGFRV